VAIERRVAAPFVDLRMFAHPGMAATNLATVLIGYTMFSAFILVPSLVQVPGVPPDGLAGGAETGFGASAIQTGLFFLPLSLAMIVAGPLSGVAADRFGRVLPLRAGLALTALGAGLFTVLRGEQWMVYAWMAVMGIGIALAMAAIASLVIDNSGPQETGVASGINAIMRMVGAALGSQVAAAVLSANTVEGTAIVTPAGYTIAFAAGAAGAALAVVPTWLLGGRGRHGHPAG
jgi:MFS family permease